MNGRGKRGGRSELTGSRLPQNNHEESQYSCVLLKLVLTLRSRFGPNKRNSSHSVSQSVHVLAHQIKKKIITKSYKPTLFIERERVEGKTRRTK